MAKRKRVSAKKAAIAEERKLIFETYHLVYYALGIIEAFLVFRMVLQLSGANPNSGFVSFIYAISGILVTPFRSIFHISTATGVETISVFEPAILIAMAVYALAGWGLAKLFAIITAGDLIEKS